MKIETKEALHVANYLAKGAFEKSYPDISISIGENAFIGLRKVGKRRYMLYIKIGVKQQTLKQRLFSAEDSVNDMAVAISNAINANADLTNIEFSLDLRIPQDDIESDEDETNADSLTSSDDEDDDADELDDELNEIEDDEDDEDDDDETEEDDSGDWQLNDVNDDEDESESESNTSDEDDFKNDESSDDFQKKYERFNENEAETMNELSTDNMLYPAHALKNNDGTLTGVDPGKIRLHDIIEDDVVENNMERIVSKMLELDKELITNIYVDAASRLLALYEDDIHKMSSDTGISMPDILLASYERKFI